MGSAKRLNDIEQGIKRALRLKHIQEGLESKKWGGPLTCVSNRPPATALSSSAPPRLDGELALMQLLTSEKSSTSTFNRPGLKRPSGSAPEAEPPAKRPKSLTQPCPTIDHQQQVQSNSQSSSTASSAVVARVAPSVNERAKIQISSDEEDPLVNVEKDYVANFFSSYHGFRYNPSSSVRAEFNRMADLFQWGRRERGKAHEKLRDALSEQFNSRYGTDVDDINNWQSLCRVLEVFPVSEDLDECRHAVLNTHVNLVDLTTLCTNDPVKLFKTERELSEYTQATEQYFPRGSICAGGLLKFLLRRIHNPPSKDNVRLWRPARH